MSDYEDEEEIEEESGTSLGVNFLQIKHNNIVQWHKL
jgi:hypothetical protein